MSVISPARNTQPLTHYDRLTPLQQDTFDRFMEIADNAVTADAYNQAIAGAAFAAAITLPTSGEIAKCACPSCPCGAIFDPAAPGLTVVETSTYGLPLLQCTDCTDDHAAPIED
ncbi:hypothetical protein [Streptomyces sp. NPDC047981]|uniref:hypothetical protein n=1 Tax=Streptomyces sp. NPDC047981 TaxID=3154610 RepID=UPI00341F8026